MRIAIFSDVHGNLTALDTVLADIKKQAPDAVAFAGDLCYAGARPAACIDRIRPDVDLFVRGNTDEFLTDFDGVVDAIPEEHHEAMQKLRPSVDWFVDKLSPEQRAWLGRLPFAHRISPSGDAADDLLIVHANPKDVHRPIMPPEAAQMTLLGKVQFAYEEEEIRPLLENVTASIVAYGHNHIPSVQTVNGIVLANISPVSLPIMRDGLARYGLLTWHKNDGWSIDHRVVAYNVDKEKELLSFLQPPNWESLAKGLG